MTLTKPIFVSLIKHGPFFHQFTVCATTHNRTPVYLYSDLWLVGLADGGKDNLMVVPSFLCDRNWLETVTTGGKGRELGCLYWEFDLSEVSEVFRFSDNR